MRSEEELLDQIQDLLIKIEKTKKETEKLRNANAELQDEVDSLWAMMDEITKSDIENYSHLLDELKADVITRTLMISKKKVDC